MFSRLELHIYVCQHMDVQIGLDKPYWDINLDLKGPKLGGGNVLLHRFDLITCFLLRPNSLRICQMCRTLVFSHQASWRANKARYQIFCCVLESIGELGVNPRQQYNVVKVKEEEGEIEDEDQLPISLDIDPSEIEICKLLNGSDWLLGRGSYGKVRIKIVLLCFWG